MKKAVIFLIAMALTIASYCQSDSTATSALAPASGQTTIAIIGTVFLGILSVAEVVLRAIPTKDNNAPVARILQFLNAISDYLNREKK